MASSSDEQNQRPVQSTHSTQSTSDTTNMDSLRLTATVAAPVNIAATALQDAYIILSKHEVRHLHTPELTSQMRKIRNTIRDIVVVASKDLRSTNPSSSSEPGQVTEEEMDVLFESFSKGAEMDVERELFVECVNVWNPNKMRHRAQFLLRAKKQYQDGDAKGKGKAKVSKEKDVLEQVQSRRYWASFAQIVRLRMAVKERQGREERPPWLSSEVLQKLTTAPGMASAPGSRPVINETRRRYLYDAYRRENFGSVGDEHDFKNFSDVLDRMNGRGWSAMLAQFGMEGLEAPDRIA